MKSRFDPWVPGRSPGKGNGNPLQYSCLGDPMDRGGCHVPAIIVSVQSVQFSRSVVSDSATPWTAARQACLSITNSRSLLKFMSIESMMPSNHLTLCLPLLRLPSIFLGISLFQWISSLHQVAKALEFQLQHQSFQWIFRTDFLWDGLVWTPCSNCKSHCRRL